MKREVPAQHHKALTTIGDCVRGALCALALVTSYNARISAQTTVVIPQRTSRGPAGIIVSRHSATAMDRAPGFILAPQPSVIFGGADVDPTFDLTKVRDVLLRRDGSLVANVANVGLLAFAPTGKPSGLLAKWGNGPDEVLSGRLAPALGDTLLYLDTGNSRIAWITASGKLAKLIPISSRLPGLASTPLGELPNHEVVVTSAGLYRESQLSEKAKKTRSSAIVVALPRTGPARQLFAMPDLNLAALPAPGTKGTIITHLAFRYAPQARLALFDGSIVSGTGDSFDLEFRDSTGNVFRSIGVSRPRTPVPTTTKRHDIDEDMSMLSRDLPKNAQFREERLDLVRNTPFTDALPAFSRIFGGNQDVLWVLDATTRSDTVWTATGFNRGGAIVGRLQGHGAYGPESITDRSALIRRVDRDGVVSFALYRIIPRTTTGRR